MSQNKQIALLEQLNLFNEKANKLKNSTFMKLMYKQGTKFYFSIRRDHIESDEWHSTSEYTAPSRDFLESFILTFRCFIQSGDGISFAEIAEVYSQLNIRSEYKEKYNRLRKYLNEYLDNPTTINIVYNDKTLIRREIMLMFVYGDLAHFNPKKRSNIQRLEKAFGPQFPILQMEFKNIIAALFGQIQKISYLNFKVISNYYL